MHKRSKHINTKSHFFRDKLEGDKIELVHATMDQLAANLLEKAL